MRKYPIPTVAAAFCTKKVYPLILLYFEAFHSMEEVMNSINWTKFCDLYVQNEHFKVFIVKNDTNCFHAGCLWYEVERVLRVTGEPGNFRIAFETRADTNEQTALDQLKAWVTSKFGKDFKFVASKQLIPGMANYILASMFMRS